MRHLLATALLCAAAMAPLASANPIPPMHPTMPAWPRPSCSSAPCRKAAAGDIVIDKVEDVADGSVLVLKSTANGASTAANGLRQVESEGHARPVAGGRHGRQPGRRLDAWTLAGLIQNSRGWDQAHYKVDSSQRTRNMGRVAIQYEDGPSEYHLNAGYASAVGGEAGTQAMQWTLAYNYNVTSRTKLTNTSMEVVL